MASFTYSFFQITLTTIFIFSTSSFASTTANSHSFKRIYAFGDSYTDTGNTKSITGPSGFGHVSSSPYGMTFFHHPTNRYSDGRLVIDFVTQELYLPFLQPYILLKDNNNASSSGVNFAVAGSTAINHAFFVNNNLTLDITPQSLQTQLFWFNKFLESQGCKGGVTTTPGCKASLDDALFWVGEIGVNDYAYIVGSEVSSDTIQKLAISTKTQFLQELLKKGAKHVVVQGLPPTGCLPMAMSLASENDRDAMGCVKSINNQTYTHNVAFRAKLQQLRVQFPQAVIVYADYWNAYATVFNNPARYGLKERFKACCGSGKPPYNFEVFAVCGSPSAKPCPNPSQYINWDGVHFTEAMYKVVADMFLHGKFSQPPFSYLLDRKQRQG